MISDRSHFRLIAGLCILLVYFGIALFVPFLHNHPSDTHFHDDCPACHWDLQAKYDDVVTASILLEIMAPLSRTPDTILEFAVFYAPQHCTISIATRGPPAHT